MKKRLCPICNEPLKDVAAGKRYWCNRRCGIMVHYDKNDQPVCGDGHGNFWRP